jgi:hypothetical protein
VPCRCIIFDSAVQLDGQILMSFIDFSRQRWKRECCSRALRFTDIGWRYIWLCLTFSATRYPSGNPFSFVFLHTPPGTFDVFSTATSSSSRYHQASLFGMWIRDGILFGFSFLFLNLILAARREELITLTTASSEIGPALKLQVVTMGKSEDAVEDHLQFCRIT